MKIKVGVIFGGCSVEHEVSVISALQAIQNIDQSKYEIKPIYISKERDFYTGDVLLKIENYQDLNALINKAQKIIIKKQGNEFVLLSDKGLFRKVIDTIDVAFPIVHGQNVEDGSLTGFLETLGIPYVGSNVLASALGQDKVVMKEVFKSSGIPIVNYVWFFDEEYLLNKDKYLKEIKDMGYPVVVKPASLGSSVGINFVKDEKEIEEAIMSAISYDRKVIVEKGVENLVEVNCSVLGNYKEMEVSLIEQVLSSKDILTFKDKYEGKGKTKASKGMVSTSRLIPAPLEKKVKEEVEEISKKVFKALNMSGVCRIDFLINSKTNEVFVNEPNTIPGSLAFYLWEGKGKKYTELLDEIITLGIREYKDKSKKVTHFDTNILKNYQQGGIKK